MPADNAERLRMFVREECDQGRITESEAIELHRYINKTADMYKACQEWWQDGDRPSIEGKHWSSAQMDLLVKKLGKLFT